MIVPARPLLATAAVLVALLAAVASPAAADDATPSPTPTPTVSEQPSPAPTDAGPQPTPEPPAPETPTPAVPAAPPAAVPADPLPLRLGARGWRVRDVQSRLRWLGYPIARSDLGRTVLGHSTQAAVKRFQTKFDALPTGVIGPGTWQLLRRVSGSVGQLPRACLGRTTVCIDMDQRLLRFVVKDHVVLTLDTRFGFAGADTRTGTFHVTRKSRDHVSSLYRTSMPFAMFFSGGQAVHYSPYFARDGYGGASHGCVNLRDYVKAGWLFDHVPLGTRVYLS